MRVWQFRVNSTAREWGSLTFLAFGLFGALEVAGLGGFGT